MITLKNILVATDFSEPSEAALLYGRRSRAPSRPRCTSCTSSTPCRASSTAPKPMRRRCRNCSRRSRIRRANSSTSCSSTTTSTALPTRQVLLTSHAPAATIVEYAGQERIDLIVIGTHGRGGVAHLLMGSVAERVVRTAPCPVLTVRHPEHEFVIPDALVAVAKA